MKKKIDIKDIMDEEIVEIKDSPNDFIYEEYFYIMALRRIFKKADPKLENEILTEVRALKNTYHAIELHDYVFYNKIV